MRVGLGTGSTVKYTVLELGRRVQEEGLEIVGVPTSIATQELALEVGIPLVELGSIDGLDIVIDGTDEFDPDFQLIKGGWRSIASREDRGSAISCYGRRCRRSKASGLFRCFWNPNRGYALACDVTVVALSRLLNCEVQLRMDGSNHKLTDNGNCIADAKIGPSIKDPIATEASILNVAGVVQVGLFNNMCDAVVLASGNGVQTLMNPTGRL